MRVIILTVNPIMAQIVWHQSNSKQVLRTNILATSTLGHVLGHLAIGPSSSKDIPPEILL